MKITFPHMGYMYIPIKVLLDTMGMDYVIPPLNNKIAFDKGVAHAPESICLPFKIMLGNIMEGIEAGADTVIFGGGSGQCRLGYYGDLYHEIFKSLSLNIRMVMLNLQNMQIQELMKNLSPITVNTPKYKVIKGILLALLTILKCERLKSSLNYIRCRAYLPEKADMVEKHMHHQIRIVKGFKSVSKIIDNTLSALSHIPLKNSFIPMKIAIVGDIFTVTEPYGNFFLEKKLGALGVESYSHLSVGSWIKEHLVQKLIPFSSKNMIKELGKQYMQTVDIGGFGLETIGSAIYAAQHGINGVIQIYPMTCTPEIIAKSAFQSIEENYHIPIMSLIMDEMTGEEGFNTRLEAFVDMLEARSTKKSVTTKSLSQNE